TLRRFTERVIACFDGDAAGRGAAARSFPVFVEAGLWGQGAFLPAGEDPDSYVRAHGAAALERCLAGAVPLVDAYVTELAGPDAAAVGRRAEAAREVARILKKVRNPFEHDVLARLAAARLGVREEVLRSEGAVEPPAPVPAASGARGPEALLVELMAADPSVAARVRDAGVIAEFQHPEWRATAEAIAAAAGAAEPAALVQSLPRALRDRVAARLLGDDPAERENREQEFADCVAAIRRRRESDAQRRLREEIRAAEAGGGGAGRGGAGARRRGRPRHGGERRPGPHVHAADGLRRPAHARRRGGDRPPHRGRRARDDPRRSRLPLRAAARPRSRGSATGR